MSDSRKWHRYLRFWRANVAADVDDELAFHIDARAQELRDAGVDTSLARTQAVREFGDVDRTRRTLRAMDERHAIHERRAHFAADLGRDVKVAVRALKRSPGLVLVTTLTFALGLGVTTAMYGVVDAFLFRPLPGAYGGSLVVLGRTDKTISLPHDLSYPDYKDYQSDTTVFASLSAYTSRFVELNTNHGAERLWIDDGTANYFTTLGLRPLLGRTFAPGDDDGVLSHPSIVLTYRGWTKYFAGDSSVVGRVIRLNDHPVTVIGVMPAEFHGVRPLIDIDGVACLNQIWPVEGADLENRGLIDVSVFGRLRRSVSFKAAGTGVRLEAEQLARAYSSTNKDVEAVLLRERDARPSPAVASVTPVLGAVFMALVFLVLLVACANVAGVLLARAAARGREFAIRAAIGASQWRLMRQVLVECVLLALIGGVGAIVVAYFALRGIDSIQVATDIPIRWGIEVDARVVAFNLGATLVAAVVVGLAAAGAARRRNLLDVLKSTSENSSAADRRRLRSVLVTAQIAVCVVVLMSAGLFLRSAANSAHMMFGFRRDHVAMLTTELRTQTYDTVRGRQVFRELMRRAAAVPGVRSVALTRYLPFGFEGNTQAVLPIAAGVSVPANGFSYFETEVAGDYFKTMNIPLLAGRTFNDHDDDKTPPVAVVNDALVKALWPGQTGVGKRFRFGVGGPIIEIVGVVRGMQNLIPGEPPKPFFFRPLSQVYDSQMTLLAYTDVAPASVLSPLRGMITGFDRSLPVFDVRTMEEHLHDGQALLFTRIGSVIASVFGLLALVLSTVGAYGVVSYSVAQRSREIGVRVALGARVPTILRLVVGQGMKLAWIGVAIGLVLSLAVSGALASILYGVAPRDPLLSAGIVMLLTFVTGLASLIPARRAARIDPLIAIRSE